MAVGFLAVQTLIAMVDLWALGNIRQDARQDLIADYAEKFPQTPPGADILAIIERASGGQSQTPGNPMLQTASRAGGVLQAGPAINVRSITFDGDSSELGLMVEADSLTALESATRLLIEAGLEADLGSSRVIDGGAEGELSLATGEGF